MTGQRHCLARFDRQLLLRMSHLYFVPSRPVVFVVSAGFLHSTITIGSLIEDVDLDHAGRKRTPADKR